MDTAILTVSHDFREAVRRLLLPIEAAREDAVLTAIHAELVAKGIAEADHSAWLRLETDRWREQGKRTPLLTSIITRALQTGHADTRLGDQLSGVYLILHREMQSKYRLSHAEASLLLSYVGLMNRFAVAEQMSAARIAAALSGEKVDALFTWRRVQDILRKLRIEPKLDRGSVEELVQRDGERERVLLLDADMQTSIALIDDLAQSLGFSDDMQALLRHLEPTGSGVAAAYLQIVYFSCAVAEFYDHPPPVIYEFSPRGDVALWLFGMVRHRHARAGNPVLNNVKAVNRLDLNWAESREGTTDYPQAEALARILLGLERMGFLARRELALWLRVLIRRIVRLGDGPKRLLPSSPNLAEVRVLLERVAANETNTNGIIEQRIVDALSSLQHEGSDNWRPRGHGDSVNATNLSRKKLGDCDYQRAESREIVAYEAHAGKLSDVYVEERLRSLLRVLERRVEELETIADRGEWRVTIIFVAHVLTARLPRSETIDGIEVTIEYRSFAELTLPTTEGHLSPIQLLEVCERLVVKPLNQVQTPDFVREAALIRMGDR